MYHWVRAETLLSTLWTRTQKSWHLSVKRGAVITIAAALLIISTGPWVPTMPEAELDPSWMTMLHEAYARHFVFGRDIIYTYGPLGFASTVQFHPATFALHLAIRALLAVGAVLGLATLAVRHSPWFLLAATAGLALVFLPPVMDPFFILAPLFGALLGIVERSNLEKAVAISLAVLGGLVALCKFTFLLFALLAFGITDLARFIDRRAWPIYLPIWGASLWAFWIAAGQPAGGLFAFLISAGQVAKSYGEFMQANGSRLDFVLFLGSCLLIAFYVRQRGQNRFTNPRVIGTGMVLLLFLFLGWKGGFVRHDEHAIAASTTIFVVALTVTVLADRLCPETSAPRLGLAGIVAGFVTCVAVQGHYLGGVQRWPLLSLQHIFNNAVAVTAILGPGDGMNHLMRQHQEAVLKIKERYPLDVGGKSVDIMPSRSVVPFALGLNYRPRPSFESCTTFNSYLSKVNNAQLLSEHGPQVMLLEFDPIDNRLATEEDPDVFLSLLQRFEVRGEQAHLLVLQRRSNPLPEMGHLLQMHPFNLGEWVELPATLDGEVLWMQADVRSTFLGRLIGTIFRLPILELEVRFADGHSTPFRLVPDVLRNGFIVSPVLMSINDYIAATSDSGGGVRRPVSVRWIGNRLADFAYAQHAIANFTSYAINKGTALEH